VVHSTSYNYRAQIKVFCNGIELSVSNFIVGFESLILALFYSPNVEYINHLPRMISNSRVFLVCLFEKSKFIIK